MTTRKRKPIVNGGAVIIDDGPGKGAEVKRLAVDTRDRRAAGLGPDLQPFALEAPGEIARFPRCLQDQSEIVLHRPAIGMASTSSDGALAEPRNSRSDPTTSRPQMSIRLPATVISVTG